VSVEGQEEKIFSWLPFAVHSPAIKAMKANCSQRALNLLRGGGNKNKAREGRGRGHGAARRNSEVKEVTTSRKGPRQSTAKPGELEERRASIPTSPNRPGYESHTIRVRDRIKKMGQKNGKPCGLFTGP